MQNLFIGTEYCHAVIYGHEIYRDLCVLSLLIEHLGAPMDCAGVEVIAGHLSAPRCAHIGNSAPRADRHRRAITQDGLASIWT
jgi:hypothetical protein